MPDPSIYALFALLFIKHFITDFALQTGWMVRTKGQYGHIGGVVHAGLHVIGSAAVLVFFTVSPLLMLTLLAGEGVVHYHLDWAKDRLVSLGGFSPTSQIFWILTGLDQLLHQLTYLVMIALIAS